MARFTSAARALRGPFKKLVNKLDLSLRRVHIKVSSRARNAAQRCGITALHGARAEAARLRKEFGKDAPTMASAAVDRRTGLLVGTGHSGHNRPVAQEVADLLPNPSRQRWKADNCAEVDAASRAVESGSRLRNLILVTVRTKSDRIEPPCSNCSEWSMEVM